MDILADILAVTRLTGRVFCHTWCTPPWGLTFDPTAEARFHLVGAGTCLLVTGRDRLTLGPQDLVLLPHGRGHALCDDPSSRRLPLDELRARVHARTAGHLPPVITTGRGRARPGARAELVCGTYAVSHAAIHPVLRLLPEVIHIPGHVAMAQPGLQATLPQLMREFNARDVGGETIISRLLEVLFVHVLRHWLDTQPEGATGWLGALRDEPIGRALVELHGAPERAWTVAQLARAVGLSRPVLARRFTAKVGDTPLGYLRRLRLDLASQLLSDTDAPLAQIAARVGYTSEFAFNRAFQRERGIPPGRYRKQLAAAA